MKHFSWLLLSVLLAASLTLGSCGGNQPKKAEKSTNTNTEQQKVDQFNALISYIENSGDLINNKIVPTMIKPEEVHENLSQYLVLDIRKHKDFLKGHIEGAKNIKMSELINYFENDIDPSSFPKIVLVCYTGQSAGFATATLRMLGYDNVYDMKWGMSSWDKTFAKTKWLKNIANTYASKLETTANPKATAGAYPKVLTTKTDGYAILRERAIKMLNDGFKKYTVKNEALFTNGANYYIINYWPEALYSKGHIPGAIQYQPKKSLGRATFLNTLPTNKTVVPYCFTGQHSAFVTAYLNLIGYDAKSLLYGANGFMNGLMKERDAKKYHAFSKKKIKGYKFIVEDAGDAPSDSNEKDEGGC